MAKVLCVLYDDPVDGYPTTYARDEIPRIISYPGGQVAEVSPGLWLVWPTVLHTLDGRPSCLLWPV